MEIPSITMKCMMVGAAINLVLDPIFIFGLKMGVFGAGIATVIGQAAAGLLCFAYVKKTKDRAHLKICFKAHLATYSADFGAGISKPADADYDCSGADYDE